MTASPGKGWMRRLFGREDRERRRKIDVELRRLGKIPRYTPACTEILGPRLELSDAPSFLVMYKEIFEQELYRFDCGHGAPLIIDCGANIGLTVIYFKTLYRDSRIIAFEPDVSLFRRLENNVSSFGLAGVTLVNKAVWRSEGILDFMSEGADGGRVVSLDSSFESYRVPAVRLKGFLDRRIDLLKMDIEGAETAVLDDCRDALGGVARLFVEYHSFAGAPQGLNTILDILDRADFRVHIHAHHASPQPFLKRDSYLGMDMMLNIFAYRE